MFGEVFDMNLYDFKHAHSDYSVITELFFYDFICTKIREKVQVGKDQEKAQSEKNSHSKNRGGKKTN